MTRRARCAPSVRGVRGVRPVRLVRLILPILLVALSACSPIPRLTTRIEQLTATAVSARPLRQEDRPSVFAAWARMLPALVAAVEPDKLIGAATGGQAIVELADQFDDSEVKIFQVTLPAHYEQDKQWLLFSEQPSNGGQAHALVPLTAETLELLKGTLEHGRWEWEAIPPLGTPATPAYPLPDPQTPPVPPPAPAP